MRKKCTTYTVIYMDDDWMGECLRTARAPQTRLDQENLPCMDFAARVMGTFYSSRETIQKLDAMCLLWVYVARRNNTLFMEDFEAIEEDYIRSYEILESFGRAIRSGYGIRDRRFNDVFRNIENTISRLGYHPYYAIKEKIAQLQGVHRNRLKYFLNMHTQGILDTSDEKSVMRGEFDSFCGFSDYEPNYESARLIASNDRELFNVEPFSKVKHYKLHCKQDAAPHRMIFEDRLAEYWGPKTKYAQLAYADVIRIKKQGVASEE